MFSIIPSSSSIILHFLLLSFSYSPFSKSNATSIYEVLSNHGLPIGLFPKGTTEPDVLDDGNVWVQFDQACNVKFETELHYERNVSGSLSYGKIEALTGLQAKDLLQWRAVTSIRVDVPSSGLIYFDVDNVQKQFSLSLFETPPNCFPVVLDTDGYVYQNNTPAP